MTLTFLTSLNWPAAAVLIVLLVVACIIICTFRVNRVDDRVKEAISHERASNARAIVNVPNS